VAPNGFTTALTYDGLDRLFELKSPATLSIHQYGCNNANNLASWLGSGGNRSFNYDNADRLIGVLTMGGNESYGAVPALTIICVQTTSDLIGPFP